MGENRYSLASSRTNIRVERRNKRNDHRFNVIAYYPVERSQKCASNVALRYIGQVAWSGSVIVYRHRGRSGTDERAVLRSRCARCDEVNM